MVAAPPRCESSRLPGLSAALGLSRRRQDGVLLVLADQALRDKCFRRVGDSGDVLPVVLPGATRSRTGAGRQLVNAAPVRVDNRTLRGIRAQISRVRNSIGIRVRLAGE